MGHFSSVFWATTWFRIMKFCVHLQVGKVYCIKKKIKMLILILPSFFQIFNFSFCHSCITHRDIFHQSFLKNCLVKDYEIFNNFVFSLKVLQPLMATAGGMWALLTSCYILHRACQAFFSHKIVIIYLSISFNMFFGCLKESSHWDGSFEYPLHMFWLRIKKIIFSYTLLSGGLLLFIL